VNRLPNAGVVLFATLGSVVACASTSQFDRYLNEHRWADAARAFSADSSLLNDDRALYSAGVLYGSPDRPTFDPAIATDMLRRLVSRFPQSKYRNDATDRLALLDQIIRARRDAENRQKELAAEIESLTADTRLLRARLDSVSLQSDGQKRNTTRLEAELRDRDEQLRTLRRELQRLKEIDLKPRKPPDGMLKP
jgi:predicted RNase H-like nuclease (RuvC/YqgF family)